MAKKSQRSNKQSSSNDKKNNSRADEPWLSQRTGLIVMIILSLGLAAFVTWQLYPSQGLSSILWGLGFAASLWVVFGIFYLFNLFFRGRR